MPSPEDPRHFETGMLMPSRYDAFFKWASMDALDDTGEADSPIGAVSLLHISREDMLSYPHPEGDVPFFDLSMKNEYEYEVEYEYEAWYVTLTDHNGIIWAFSFGSGTLPEENARQEFAGSQKAYSLWLMDDGS